MGGGFGASKHMSVGGRKGGALFFDKCPTTGVGGQSSVHNYSTYPMLLHKCSKNVVFLNEICSKYVVN